MLKIPKTPPLLLDDEPTSLADREAMTEVVIADGLAAGDDRSGCRIIARLRREAGVRPPRVLTDPVDFLNTGMPRCFLGVQRLERAGDDALLRDLLRARGGPARLRALHAWRRARPGADPTPALRKNRWRVFASASDSEWRLLHRGMVLEKLAAPERAALLLHAAANPQGVLRRVLAELPPPGQRVLTLAFAVAVKAGVAANAEELARAGARIGEARIGGVGAREHALSHGRTALDRRLAELGLPAPEALTGAPHPRLGTGRHRAEHWLRRLPVGVRLAADFREAAFDRFSAGAMRALMRHGHYPPEARRDAILLQACRHDRPASPLGVLLELGARADATDARGNTPLHLAWRAGALRTLLRHGANPVAPNVLGETPLHLAFSRGDARACAVMWHAVEHDHPAAAAEALHCWAASGRVHPVWHYRQRHALGADYRERRAATRTRLLHRLLVTPERLESIDGAGRTALVVAAESRDAKSFLELQAAGADPEALVPDASRATLARLPESAWRTLLPIVRWTEAQWRRWLANAPDAGSHLDSALQNPHFPQALRARLSGGES